MTDKTTPVRERIIEAADQLFYQQGFEQTSFSHIADAVKISRGNFYYHFKSKDEILQAVIGMRMARIEQMLTQWEAELPQPYERILRYIDILITNQAHIKKYGCPVGSLCSELTKLLHASQTDANALLVIYRSWLTKQFTLLGHQADATALAMHFHPVRTPLQVPKIVRELFGE